MRGRCISVAAMAAVFLLVAVPAFAGEEWVTLDGVLYGDSGDIEEIFCPAGNCPDDWVPSLAPPKIMVKKEGGVVKLYGELPDVSALCIVQTESGLLFVRPQEISLVGNMGVETLQRTISLSVRGEARLYICPGMIPQTVVVWVYEL